MWVLLSLLVAVCLAGPANTASNAATNTLFTKLRNLGNSDYIAFGQEFPTDFGTTEGLNNKYDTSDCKDVVGSHPAVHGSDFHYYLYKDSTEAATHKGAVLAAHNRGAIITFDWHMYDRSNTYGANGGNSQLVANIVNNAGSDKAWFLGELDKVIALFKNDFARVPIVFRPFHEMTGNWFWWGSQNTKPNYQALFRLTFDYFKTKGVNNVLWCWSPDKTLDWQYYPGDNYVDVIGMDVYEPGLVSYFSTAQLISVLSEMTDYAVAKGKVAALTETGARDGNSIESNPTFWTQKILNPIKANAKAKKIAWILTWINSPPSWGAKPYIPHLGSGQAQIADFLAFYNDPYTLFENDLNTFFSRPIPAPVPPTSGSPTPPPGPSTPPPPGPSGSCTDIPPDAVYTCPQQAAWGKCGQSWMAGKCNFSCARCGCTNNPPAGGYTCQQQVGWGKCGETWMQGYCNFGCNRCSTLQGASDVTMVGETGTTSGDAPFPGWGIAVIVIVGVAALVAVVAGAVYFLKPTSAERV